MTPSEKAFCSRILKALLDHKCADLFKEPVDPVYYDIPDYFDIVKNPMDLGTIRNKLESNQYPTMTDFTDDINLTFNNCYLYNNETDPVCYDARVLEGILKKWLPGARVSNKPKPKKMPAQSIHRPITPISNDSFNDNESRSSKMSESDDRFDDLFGEEELSEEEHMEEEVKEKRGVKRAADDNKEKMPEEMPEEQRKRCSAMIDELKKRKYKDLTWAFEKPVDPAAWGCHDYYDIVKHPMDMSTFEQKFITNQYHHEDQLASDIRLMLNNCFLYNPPDNPVHQSAKKLERIFDEYWSKLHAISNDAIKERPKKKLKVKITDDLKKDGSKHTASIEGIKLRIKLTHKPKDAKDGNNVEVPTNVKKGSAQLLSAPSTSNTTTITSSSSSRVSVVPSSTDTSPSHHRRVSSSSNQPRLALAREPPARSNTVSVVPSSTDPSPSHSRRLSSSSLSSYTSSSNQPRLAIAREPPARSNTTNYGSYRRTSSSSSSSTGSGYESKLGDIYPESSSTTKYENTCKLGDTSYPSSSSSKDSFTDGFPTTRYGNSYKLGSTSCPEVSSSRASSSRTSFDNDDYHLSSSSSPTHSEHEFHRQHSSSVYSTRDYKASMHRLPHRDDSFSVHTAKDITNTHHSSGAPSNNPSRRPSGSTSTDKKNIHDSTSSSSRKRQASFQRPDQKRVARPSPKTPAMVSVFDIVDKLESEKKVREEQVERERQEYIKRVEAEAKREQLYREKRDELKKADRQRRMAELNAGTIDISRQKVLMNQFEREVLSHDKDFREMRHYYAKTTDYRTNVPPPFLRKLDVGLDEIGRNLLSAAGKCMNNMVYEEDSDMEVEEETGMEELD